MPDKRSPYLCGGVMFVLLKQAALSSLAAKDYRQGMSDRQSDLNLIVDMIQALRSEDYVLDEKAYKDDAFKTSVSRYVNCLSNVPKKLPFSQIPFIDSNNELVISHYSKAIEKMQMFIRVHLDPNSCKWLVKAILYTIEKDTDIKDSDQFFISPDGMPKTKADMRGMDQFYLPCVLVGVMHYIISNRKNNEYGVKTLEEWGTKKKSGKRDYSNIDTHICFDRNIEVFFDCHQFIAEQGVQKSEPIEEEILSEVSVNKECTSNEIYDKIVSMEGKILGRLQSPPPKSPIVSIRLTKPEYITTARNQDVQLYEHFKADIKDTLAYMIQHDPSVDPLERSLPTTLADLNTQWNHMLCMFEDDIMRGEVSRILDLLDMYGYYLSDEYMRIDEVNNFLVCRNQSLEEKYKCNKILAPNIYDIRYALKRQYNKLYNANDGEDFVSSD